MANKKPLTEQEKRYLNRVKLLFERSEGHKISETAKWMDEQSPEQARATITFYQLGLEDPRAFRLAYKLLGWISPILHPWAHFRNIFRSRKSLR